MRFLSTLILFAACSSSSTTTLTITGSSTIAPLMSDMAKRYEKMHPGVRVDVQTGGSSRGVADVLRGLADIGMVSRALKEGENVDAHLVARDGLCMIVHKSNPVESLGDDDIVRIYQDRVNDWAVFGGKGPITVVHKAEGRSTLEIFLAHFHLDNKSVVPDVIIGDNEQGIKTVSANPGAIGYVSIGTAQTDANAGAAIRLLPLGGVKASSANIENGTFPLSRQLNLITQGRIKKTAADFLSFVTSRQTDDLVARHGFIRVR